MPEGVGPTHDEFLALQSEHRSLERRVDSFDPRFRRVYDDMCRFADDLGKVDQRIDWFDDTQTSQQVAHLEREVARQARDLARLQGQIDPLLRLQTTAPSTLPSIAYQAPMRPRSPEPGRDKA